jgi:hypothetical protein
MYNGDGACLTVQHDSDLFVVSLFDKKKKKKREAKE